jgi:uncharacterized membrane protein
MIRETPARRRDAAADRAWRAVVGRPLNRRRLAMSPVGWISLWAILFLATHVVTSSGYIRPRLVSALGADAYRGAYSLIGLGTLVPLVLEFAWHKHAGVMLWNLRGDEALRWLVWALMLLALILIVAGFINPSPVQNFTPTEAGAPRGILKITRHPSFVGLATFGFAHMIMNGWAGDLVFFGTFPALGIIGGLHQDRRKVREFGASYRSFVEATSFIPCAALISGRQKFSRGDIPWTAIAIGAVLTIAIVIVHPFLFGGNPLG